MGVAVVKANFLPRLQTGRLRRGVAYYTWRDGQDRPRAHPRSWHGADGRTLDYTTARRELTEAAQRAAYTYRIVLSPGGGEGLAPEAYGAVLGRCFDRWYVVAHHFGEHPHAHAVAFADRRLGRNDLQAMREALGAQDRLRERSREQVAREGAAPPAGRDVSRAGRAEGPDRWR